MAVSDAPPSTVTFAAPLDVAGYFVGTWKRCMEERDFGGCYQFRRTNNLIIFITAEEDSDPEKRTITWSIAKTPNKEDSRVMYSMNISEKNKREASITYSYEGMPCDGKFVIGPNAMILNHVENEDYTAVVTLTYRIIDDNNVALSVAECDSKGPSRILTGMMHRIDLSSYPT
eukprot:TRINITY_DN26582_c0_g1_i1.p1 TRINITY_DN26582_c0_g1~~TRINITY_DN26582_c0_g1_i1.p1  ORF type:complete len:173 (+),score=30.53 TRINITY_DN26582_c0_g1_i1:71-589(+)